MKKVVKFGGSSLASAEQFKKSRRIIVRRRATRKICGTFCTGQALFRGYKSNGFAVCLLLGSLE